MNRLKEIVLACICTAVVFIIVSTAINFGNRIDSVDNKVESAVSGLDSKVESIVSFLSTTTTSTSTTSTTTSTTTTTLPPKPVDSRSALVRKVDEIYPGASTKYSAAVIEKAGKFACKRWNEAPITRFNVIRDIMEYTGIDDLTFGHAVAEAVVWTICWETTSFPNGPREYR